MSSEQQTLPERPAEAPVAAAATEPAASSATAPAATEGGEKLSKNALKKLAKDREKAEKKKAQQEREAAAKAQSDASDISKDSYGDLPIIGSAEYKPLGRPRTKLTELYEIADGTEVTIRCRISNARIQSAKLGFLVLRDRHDSVQAVIAAVEGQLSRQMVKFACSIPNESIVEVIGTAKKSPEPVKSATVTEIELHIAQIWVVSKAIPKLPIQVDACERAIPAENVPVEEQKSADGVPLVSLPTRLDNRSLDLRSSLNQAIFEIRDGVHLLFEEYLRSHNFLKIDTPKLLGAPSEGGANVFEVGYFDKKAYLAQSPQLYKQMLIAADYKRVFEAAPV
jgi:aspartyl-tRNA synthetase